ncbi:MAG: SDR family oxidoreductase [Gammaproteobacteria bacterium]|nr:SDR family oxidoreductase [Gammaproteobacteria bacterium]
MNNKILVVLVTAILVTAFTPANASAADDGDKQAVLITGASSGIGRATAEKLAAEGYFVYAGVRKAADIDALNKIDGVMAIRLDVTVQKEIDEAVALIKSEGRGLWGVVNNAGINIIDPLIEANESDLDFLFDVNVYGVFRVTKAFAPLVIESKGRIVNISSIAGVLSGGLPAYGMYMMSKHAVEAYTDQLSFEMAAFGVKVSAVEPGNYRSDIGASRCKRMIAASVDRQYVYFADVMQNYLDGCKEYIAEGGVSDDTPPDRVVDAIQHALFSETPKEHYLVVPEQFQAMITIGKTIEELLHLNQEHEHSYSRAQLIEMLDEEWAILRGEKTRNWGGDD